MPTYYVRTTGSDAAAGTSAGTAWLTIDKAANTVAAGDTVYIGAGVYRELVTMDTSGTSGNVISYIADIDGSQTGDAGLVIVTAHDSETAAPARANCLDVNAKEFIEWYNVTFHGGTGNVVTSPGGNVAYEGFVMDGCVFVPYNTQITTVYFNMDQAATPSTTGLTIRNCTFHGGFAIEADENATVARNIKATIENNVFVGYGRVGTFANAAFRFYVTVVNTFPVGGVTVSNNTIIGYEYGIGTFQAKNTTDLVTASNNLILFTSYPIYRNGGTAGAFVSGGNNFMTGYSSAFTGVTADASDDSTGMFGALGGMADMPLYRVLGWSPFKPWEPIDISGYTSPLIDNGNATYAPSTDIYGNPRPMGRNADDAGAVEARIRPAQEASTVYAGTYSARFDGAGYYDAMRAVDASSTTITVYCQKDANYTGTAPKLEVVNIPGVADQSDSLSVGSGSWEQLSVTFTPTEAGWVRIRLWSYDTSATGKCFFDDLAVS